MSFWELTLKLNSLLVWELRFVFIQYFAWSSIRIIRDNSWFLGQLSIKCLRGLTCLGLKNLRLMFYFKITIFNFFNRISILTLSTFQTFSMSIWQRIWELWLRWFQFLPCLLWTIFLWFLNLNRICLHIFILAIYLCLFFFILFRYFYDISHFDYLLLQFKIFFYLILLLLMS